MSSNQIGDAGEQAVAETLKKNDTVNKIDLHCDQIGDAGVEALSEALKVNKTVTWIGLAGNQINDAGAEAFAETLKINKTVADIELFGNLIGDEQALTQALKENKHAYCRIDQFRYLTPSGPASWMVGRYSIACEVSQHVATSRSQCSGFLCCVDSVDAAISGQATWSPARCRDSWLHLSFLPTFTA